MHEVWKRKQIHENVRVGVLDQNYCQKVWENGEDAIWEDRKNGQKREVIADGPKGAGSVGAQHLAAWRASFFLFRRSWQLCQTARSSTLSSGWLSDPRVEERK